MQDVVWSITDVWQSTKYTFPHSSNLQGLPVIELWHESKLFVVCSLARKNKVSEDFIKMCQDPHNNTWASFEKMIAFKIIFKSLIESWSLFSQSDSSYFEKLKMTLLGSCIEVLDLTKLLNFFCWIALFDARILLLLLRNNELTWAKSIKLISCCNEEWLELNSFFKTLISDFLWWISSYNSFNWHCLYVKEALR